VSYAGVGGNATLSAKPLRFTFGGGTYLSLPCWVFVTFDWKRMLQDIRVPSYGADEVDAMLAGDRILLSFTFCTIVSAALCLKVRKSSLNYALHCLNRMKASNEVQ
jgi:hypothetical protein